ncbi:hypothetical protein [Prosthecomicrobium sp. N25]|uniref:hypothetical protein n=1 Tax=Prosthecomicrobium sp. N25 TaxID=3129254 RepID=UPI003077F603
MRNIEATVTFTRPFELASLEGAHPAGTYRLSIDEEEIEGLSFAAYRRVATHLFLPSMGEAREARQMVTIDKIELEEAIARDRDRS